MEADNLNVLKVIDVLVYIGESFLSSDNMIVMLALPRLR